MMSARGVVTMSMSMSMSMSTGFVCACVDGWMDGLFSSPGGIYGEFS